MASRRRKDQLPAVIPPEEEKRELPNNIEVEQALLGAILINNGALDRVRFLEPEHFYEEIHQRIFEAARSLVGRGKTVNPITIKTFLPREKVGDMTVSQYLARLATEAVTIVNAFEYGMTIYGLYQQRYAIILMREELDRAFIVNPDVDYIGGDHPPQIVGELMELHAKRIITKTKRQGAAYLAEMEATRDRGYVYGVPIVLKEIQRVISEESFETGNLYGLLSASGEGKTSLVGQITRHALQHGSPVLFQTYDQSASQIIRQMAAQAHSIEARRQRAARDLGNKEWMSLAEFARWIDEQPFYIYECLKREKASHLVEIASRFAKANKDRGPILVITDHVNACTPEIGTEKADEGTKAAGSTAMMKLGARELNVAWLALNQRNSKGMLRDNPRPITADLYGGQAAKRAYDAIFYLYRYKKYLEEQRAVAATAADIKRTTQASSIFPSDVIAGEDIAQIGALKVRFGDEYQTETVDFKGKYTRYEPHVAETGIASQEEIDFFSGTMQ